MKRCEKIGWSLAIIMALIGIYVSYWGFSTQGWSQVETTQQIWLPENYQLLNKEVSGSYRSMVDIQLEGTVVSISLEEFQELFNNATVAVTSKGEVRYFVQEDKLTITASEQLMVGGSFPEKVQMMSDRDVKLVDDTALGNGCLCFFGIFMLGVLGFGIGVIIDKVLPKSKKQ